MAVCVEKSTGNFALTAFHSALGDTIVTFYDMSGDKPLTSKLFSIQGSPLESSFFGSNAIIATEHAAHIVSPTTPQSQIGVLESSGPSLICLAVLGEKTVLLGTSSGALIYDLNLRSYSSKPSGKLAASGKTVQSICSISNDIVALSTGPSIELYDIRSPTRSVNSWSISTGSQSNTILRRIPTQEFTFSALSDDHQLTIWDARSTVKQILDLEIPPRQEIQWSESKRWTALLIGESATDYWLFWESNDGDISQLGDPLKTGLPPTNRPLPNPLKAVFLPDSPNALTLCSDGSLQSLPIPSRPSLTPLVSGGILSASLCGELNFHHDDSIIASMRRKEDEKWTRWKRDPFWRWLSRASGNGTRRNSAIRRPSGSPNVAAIFPTTALSILLGENQEGKFLSAILGLDFQAAISLATAEARDHEVMVCLHAAAVAGIGSASMASSSLFRSCVDSLKDPQHYSSWLVSDAIAILKFVDFIDRQGTEEGNRKTIILDHLVSLEKQPIWLRGACAESVGLLNQFKARIGPAVVSAGRLDGIPLFYVAPTDPDSVSETHARYCHCRSQIAPILAEYVGRTSDVQTPSNLLLMIRQHPALKSLNDCKFIVHVARKYLGLLSSWGFWDTRAKLAVVLGDEAGASTMHCFYCDRLLTGGGSRCPVPACRKQLPSCSICLDPVSASGTVWCIRCRHGGHSSHLAEWFSEYEECAVAGCSCQCASLD